MEEKRKFIFFESWERYLKSLEDDKDINYVNAVARAIIQYGIYGECETKDATIIRKVDAVCSDLMNNTKARYASSLTVGGQGGRPVRYDPAVIRQLRDSGMTHIEIAEKLGCSKRTVQRALGEDEI